MVEFWINKTNPIYPHIFQLVPLSNSNIHIVIIFSNTRCFYFFLKFQLAMVNIYYESTTPNSNPICLEIFQKNLQTTVKIYYELTSATPICLEIFQLFHLSTIKIHFQINAPNSICFYIFQ